MSEESEALKKIDSSLGWMIVILFIIMLATCTERPPEVTVTVDQCNGSYDIK